MASDENPPDDKGFTVRDQRWWLRDEADLERLAEGGETHRPPTAIEELQTRLAERDERLQEVLAAHRAAAAEMDEVRARLQNDLERRVTVERARLAEPFVDVLEGLTRLEASARQAGPAAEALTAGVELLGRQLHDRLTGLGLTPVPAAPGDAFDPRRMEALSTADGPPGLAGRVVEVLRPGYLLGEHLVRPAGVLVGREPQE
jgi:molecular chaperone GrpE